MRHRGIFKHGHRGYMGSFEIGPPWHDGGVEIEGRVLGMKDIITFGGSTIKEARKSFEDAVDDYLALCAELGESPTRD